METITAKKKYPPCPKWKDQTHMKWSTEVEEEIRKECLKYTKVRYYTGILNYDEIGNS